MMEKFFVGLHQVRLVKHFDRACVSINALRRPGGIRKSPVPVSPGAEILLDSGAFTELARHGGYRHSVFQYANAVRRALPLFGCQVTVVSQDWMCEPFMLERTGLSVIEHQKRTIARYDALLAEEIPAPILPVLQGYDPTDYARHVREYGDRLAPGAWVGVGSVCKRNSRPLEIIEVLWAIHQERPDLRMHGFGVKTTALLEPAVRHLLYSADSMAWSYAARREQSGRQNDWREAERFRLRVEGVAGRPIDAWQPGLPLEAAA